MPASDKLRVLIVDDDATAVMTTSAILEDEGHTVTSRTEVFGTLAVAVREQPDVFGEALEPKAELLKEQSRALAGQLERGRGHDHTSGFYLSLREIVDDTEVEARRAELDEPTLAAWAKVADLWRQLSPYYDPKAPDGS